MLFRKSFLSLFGNKYISVKQVRNVRTSGQRTGSQLQIYVPPRWAENLKNIPKYKINLLNNNTPIEEWNIPGLPEGFSVHIKRDDMTGCTITGNKIRKLEFLLADAIAKKCRHVITYGAVQSNHCRAVAIAARSIGLIPHLILRSDITTASQLGCHGNVLLERMCGSHIYIMPQFDRKSLTRSEVYEKFFMPRLEKLESYITKKTGDKCYKIAFGGSDEVGLFGMISLFEEMEHQGILENFDDLVVACASGGLTAGLCIANYSTGSRLKCHGIAASDNGEFLIEHLSQMLRHTGLHDVNAVDIVDMIYGYKGDINQKQLQYLVDVGSATGIILDPVYTGKAALAMIQELNQNQNRFKGRRILFLHTGGLFSIFNGRMEMVLKNSDIKMWTDIDTIPD